MNLIQSEMRKYLGRLGYETRYDDSTGHLTAVLDGKNICTVKESQLSFDGDSQQKIIDEYHKIRDYVNAYENAPLLGAGVDRYRKLCEFNDFVLAAKVMQDNSFEFVVWSYTFDRKGVCDGTYIYNYDEAKERFAVRSGLVQEGFSDKDMKIIHDSLKFTQQNDDIGFKRFKEIGEIIERIEEKIPKLAEQAQDESLKMNM